jgi:sortase A
MKTYRTGSAKRTLVAAVGAVMILVGLALLTISSLDGGSAASAETSRDVRKGVVERVVEKQRPEAPQNKTLKLTVPDMKRVKNVPVRDAAEKGEEKALHDGTLHVRGTGFPWQEEANVYIAGHRLGYPGTRSHRVFWDLNELERGDRIFLTDADGTRYTYKVFRKFVVDPTDVHVLRPIAGKNVVSLQTCTLPDYSRRMIVQGELVSVE